MSISANTYEEMRIHVMDEKTAEVARLVGEYLLKTWGIVSLSLTVDGIRYGEDTEGSIPAGTALHTVCEKLAEAHEITLAMRSENGGGASWRMDAGFMRALTDDTSVRNNVVYRSTDYYDTDSYVDLYLYDAHGLQKPGYEQNCESVADIRRWFCNTPTLRITCDEETENEALHEEILSVLTELCMEHFGLDEDEAEEMLDDDWEGGAISLFGSLSFAGTSIPEIIALLERLLSLVRKPGTMEMELELCAVPDGEGDYDFASVQFVVRDGTVCAGYCRF